MFCSINDLLIEKNDCKTFIAKVIIGHLTALKAQFRMYFAPNIDLKKLSWIQKPFSIGLSEMLPY